MGRAAFTAALVSIEMSQAEKNMQSWIEVAGKLAPAFIAFLVLVTNRVQNRSINAVSLRAAQVEDQKLRLSLLERRLQAIDAIREAVGHYQATGQLTGEARGKLVDALRLAEVVFAEEHERTIASIITLGWRWSTLNRKLDRPGTTDEERNKLVDQLVEMDGTFESTITKLVPTLIAATRMHDIAPLQLPRSKIWAAIVRLPATAISGWKR